LNKGHHAYIHHPSAVNYGDARLIKIEKLKISISIGEAESFKSPLKTFALEKLREGFHKSPLTKPKILNYLKQCGF